jgi:hypothetical protein
LPDVWLGRRVRGGTVRGWRLPLDKVLYFDRPLAARFILALHCGDHERRCGLQLALGDDGDDPCRLGIANRNHFQ